MGNFSSHENDLWKSYLRHFRSQHSYTVVGGSEVLGGYSALEEYGNSVYSKAKEELIRGLAKDVSGVLGMKNIETGPLDVVIKKFKEVLPKPGTGKGTLRADPAKHAKLCTMLAKAINRRYGMQILDEQAEPHQICQRVAELMYSLFTGLHTEFLTIAGDVSRIVKNLEVLQGIVDSANQKIMNDLAKSTDGMISSEAEQSKELYKKISDEIRRQHVMLSNIINSSIGPVGSSLISVLSDNKDFTGLVEDLKKTTGTQYFGDKLAHLLSGISTIAHSAHLVDKALNKIGMSVAEYKNTKGMMDLRKKVYDAISRKKPSSTEIHKLLIAADILYRNDLAHDDIADYLSKKEHHTVGGQSGGDDLDPVEPSFADMVDDATWQDTSNSPFVGRTQSYRKSIGKQVRDQRKYRNMLFADFNTQIKTQYATFINLLIKISQKIGGEIPISDKLEQFIRLLNNFAAIQPDRKNLHIALSSYRSDATSNFIKYQYIDYLDILKEESDKLAQITNNPYFREISQVLGNLLHTIDEFNINFTNTLSESHIEGGPRIQKVGGRDDNIDDDNKSIHNRKKHKNISEFIKHSEHEIKEQQELDSELLADETDERRDDEFKKDIYGGSPTEDILGGIIKSYSDTSFKHFKSLKQTIRQMDYFYRIANIKSSLRKTSFENKANVENYENILGEEAGWIIDEINLRYGALVASATGTAQDLQKFNITSERDLRSIGYESITNPVAGTLFDNVLNDNYRTGLGDEASKYKNGYLFLLDYIKTAKIEMIEAAQALDLYLSQFTQKIEQDPDTIKNFVEIIEQLEIVAKWFTDRSGDSLAEVFEAFPYQYGAAGALGGISYNSYATPFGGNLIATYDAKIGNYINNKLNSEYKITTNHYYSKIAAHTVNHSTGMAYQPVLMTKEQAIEFVKQIEKSLKGVRALENIINIFSKVNSHTSGDVKTFMNAGMMFKAFMKYCVASVIGLGYRIVMDKAAIVAENDNKCNVTIPIIDFKDAADAKGLENIALTSVYVKTGVTLRFNNEFIRFNANNAAHAQKYLRLCDPFELPQDIKSQTSLTDKIFEMCIKSMVSKIFVVIGSYSLFNRPSKSNQLFKSINASYANNPLRQIIGGNKSESHTDLVNQVGGRNPVEIIPDALELYMRLPLLVEWYRTVFEFDKNNRNNNSDYTHQNNPLVSLIPDMDNIWRPICMAIMVDSANILEGGYPSDIAHKIISNITDIYKQYKAKKQNISCKEIIQEFVFEINRRYGFMKREEIMSYLDNRDNIAKSKTDLYPDNEEDIDYDLLDTVSQYGRRIAPSDRFRKLSSSFSGERNPMTSFYIAVRRFRLSVEANLLLTKNIDEFGNPIDFDMRINGDVDIDQIIRITRSKLNKATTPEQKYNLIHSQLHGVDKFSNVDQQKLLLLHETVINPLTVLYFVYLIVNDFNKFMVSMNLEHFKEVVDAYLNGGIGAPARPGIAHHGCNKTVANGGYGVINAGADTDSGDVGAAAPAAATESGNPHIWLPLKLLEFNNKKFKGSNSVSAYGLPENNYRKEVEGLYQLDHIIQYFNYGFDGAPCTPATPVANVEGSRSIVGEGSGFITISNDAAVGGAAPYDHTLSRPDVPVSSITGDANFLGLIDQRGLDYKSRESLDARSKVLQRFGLNRRHLMETVLRKLMDLSCDLNGLVEVHFSGESKTRYPRVIFDKLEEVCTSLFQQAKQSLSKLRKSLPVSMITSLESSHINQDNKRVTNSVSMFYIQEHLFDRLFKNKYGNGLDDGNIGLKHIWLELTRKHDFNHIHMEVIIGAAGNQIDQYCIAELTGGEDTANTSFFGIDGKRKTIIGVPDVRVKGINVKFSSGQFSATAEELKQNRTLYDSLHREYCYDSYSSVISKLLAWTNEYKDDIFPLQQFLGFNSLLMSNNIKEFPGMYVPVFAGGDSAATARSEALKTRIASMLTSDAKDGAGIVNDFKFFNLKNCIAADCNNNYAIYTGFNNLYNYNINYSGKTHVTKDDFYTSFNKPSTDNVLPEFGSLFAADNKFDYSYITNNLGLISKLNNIVYNYIKMFLDPSNKKIYKPLIDKFVGGICSKDILQGKNINDLVLVHDYFMDSAITAEKAIDMTQALLAPGAAHYVTVALLRAAKNRLEAYRSGTCHFDVPEKAVLFSSLANAIGTIYNARADRATGMIPTHLEENFANVSDFQKEMMRAYLPIFEKQLEMIINRAELIRNVIELTSCKVYKWNLHYQGTADAAGAPAGAIVPDTVALYDSLGHPLVIGIDPSVKIRYATAGELDSSYIQPLRYGRVESETSRKGYLQGMANDIISASKSLLMCINTVQKELSDIPLYFETYKDSLVDYNNKNQQLPIMPLSMLTNLMNFNILRTEKSGLTQYITDDRIYDEKDEQKSAYSMVLLPDVTGVGSTRFKYAYGTRGLLSPRQKPLLDYIPSMAALSEYSKFDKHSIEMTANNVVILSRFILDYFYHAQYLNNQNYHLIRKLIVDNQRSLSKEAKTAQKVHNLSCQTSKFSSIDDTSGSGSFWSNPQNAINLLENDDIKPSLYRLTSCLRSNSNNTLYNTDRKQLQICNILDLNIVPINVHAMQREIPFINLINYSHTFDHIVKDTIGVKFKNSALTDIHGNQPFGYNPDGGEGEVSHLVNPNSKNAYYNVDTGDQVYSQNEFLGTIYPEDQLVRNLIYPLGFRRLSEYVNHVYKIMAGNTSLSLNRPKYLSDQLWNKVLLNSLYDNDYGETSNYLAAARRVSDLSQVRNIYNDNDIVRGVTNHIFGDNKIIMNQYNAILADYKQMIANFSAFTQAIGVNTRDKVWLLNNFCFTITSGGQYPNAKISADNGGGIFGADQELASMAEIIATYNGNKPNSGAFNGALPANRWPGAGGGPPARLIGLANNQIHPAYFIADLMAALCLINPAAGVVVDNNARAEWLSTRGYDRVACVYAIGRVNEVKDTGALLAIQFTAVVGGVAGHAAAGDIKLDGATDTLTTANATTILDAIIGIYDGTAAAVVANCPDIAMNKPDVKEQEMGNYTDFSTNFYKDILRHFTGDPVLRIVGDPAGMPHCDIPDATALGARSFHDPNMRTAYYIMNKIFNGAAGGETPATIMFALYADKLIRDIGAAPPAVANDFTANFPQLSNIDFKANRLLPANYDLRLTEEKYIQDVQQKLNLAIVTEVKRLHDLDRLDRLNFETRIVYNIIRHLHNFNHYVESKIAADLITYVDVVGGPHDAKMNTNARDASTNALSTWANAVAMPNAAARAAASDLVNMRFVIDNKDYYGVEGEGVPTAATHMGVATDLDFKLFNAASDVSALVASMIPTVVVADARVGYTQVPEAKREQDGKYAVGASDEQKVWETSSLTWNEIKAAAINYVAPNSGSEFNRNLRPVEIKIANIFSYVDNDMQEPLTGGLVDLKKTDIGEYNFPVVRKLSYMKSTGDIETVYNDMGINRSHNQRLGLEGYLRYSTRLIRWVEWISQVQRLTRIIMRQQLDWVQDPIVREHNVLAEGTTEYDSNNMGYSLQDFE